MTIDILIQASIAVISAIAGAVLLFTIKLNHDKLCALISFSAGALFGAAVFTVLPESFGIISYWETILGFASGYALFWLISKYYYHICPACSASHFDEQQTKKFSEIVLTLTTVLSFHSLLDGIAIASGNASHSHHENSLFIAITTHKFPEGLALASLMLGAGYKKIKILSFVLIIESTTIAGAVIGILFLEQAVNPVWLGIIMSHIAGGFIYLAFHAIFGEMMKNHLKLVVSTFLGGIGLIFAVQLIFN